MPQNTTLIFTEEGMTDSVKVLMAIAAGAPFDGKTTFDEKTRIGSIHFSLRAPTEAQFNCDYHRRKVLTPK